jgi:acyl-CoA hydrolase
VDQQEEPPQELSPAGGKPVRASQVVVSQLMMPADANAAGNVHGGAVLRLIDETAAVTAMRHCRRRVVTARLDDMSFERPVFIGNLLTLMASANHAGRTSVEVGVRAEAEDLITGDRWHVASAYLIFVALDDAGRPTPVPPLIPETDLDRRRMRQADHRRKLRERHQREMTRLMQVE